MKFGIVAGPVFPTYSEMPSEEAFLGVTPEARGIARDIQPPTPVSATRGIVVVRGPDKGYSYQRHVEAVLKEARCTARSF